MEHHIGRGGITLILMLLQGCQLSPTTTTPGHPADGLYRVLERSADPSQLRPAPDQIVVIDKKRFVRSELLPETTWVLLNAVADVPVQLTRRPEVRRGEDGRDRILLSFTERASKSLASFSTANVGATVACLASIVSVHPATIRFVHDAGLQGGVRGDEVLPI